jgi:hypothetical protein
MERIGVIGAGTMGNGIAQAFAMAGHPVVLQDISEPALAKAQASIETSLARLAKREKISADDARMSLERIAVSREVSDLKASDLVVEAIVENIEIKSKVLAQLDTLCSAETIFASNTSSISLTRLASASSRPERMIGAEDQHLVDVLGRGEPLIDAVDRFVDHRDQHAVDDEAVAVLRHMRGLADPARQIGDARAHRLAGLQGADDPHQLHHRHRIEEVHPDDALGP